VIANADQLKGKLKENVLNFHEKATFSKWLATIKTDAVIHVHLDETLYQANVAGANAFYEKYEMKSLIKEVNVQAEALKQVDVSNLDFSAPLALFGHYRLDGDWPHTLLGFALSDGSNSSYLELSTWDHLHDFHARLSQHKNLYVYDAKSLYHAQTETFKLPSFMYDVMMMAFIEDSNLNTYDKVKDQMDWPAYPTARIDEENTQKCVEIAQRLLKSGQSIQEKLIQSDLWSVYTDIDYPLVDILYRMEKEGIHVKQTILEDIASSTLQKLNALSEIIYGHAGQSFNINSPKQLGEILFNQLNLSANRKQSTSIDVLESLRHEHPIIEPLIEYRKYQKIYSTYAIGLQKFIQKDQKIHTVYAMTIAQTGRLSSTDPNLQNISIRDEEAREIRKAFVPSVGNVLYSCDYSQIELRVLAHMAKEEALIEAFKQGLDIHTKTAMDVFGYTKEEVGSNERRAAKAVNFGIIYGISDFGLAAQINTDRKSAKHFIERYLKTYQGISTYMDQTIVRCQELGYVETLYKRRRTLPEIKSSNYQVREFAKRAAMNAPIQGSAADIMKIAMVKVDEALKAAKLRAKMILQVHDELVFDVPEEELETVRALVEKTMRDAVELEVPMEVSSAWGANWYEAK
jgi:DNA polymerase-1